MFAMGRFDLCGCESIELSATAFLGTSMYLCVFKMRYSNGNLNRADYQECMSMLMLITLRSWCDHLFRRDSYYRL